MALISLAKAHAIADDRTEVNEEDIDLVRRVAFDSLPTARRRAVQLMFMRASLQRANIRQGISIETLTKVCHTTQTSIKDMLVQYIHCKIMEIASDDPVLYRLTQDIYSIMNRCGLFTGSHIYGKEKPK